MESNVTWRDHFLEFTMSKSLGGVLRVVLITGSSAVALEKSGVKEASESSYVEEYLKGFFK